jgi:hypothetical protein
MNFLKNHIAGILILSIVASIIATIITNGFANNDVQKKLTLKSKVLNPEPLEPNKDQTPKKRNIFSVQSYSTIEIFDGDLTITLNDMVEYSNQRIHLVVSQTGKPQQNFDELYLGDKIFYEGYEVTFIDTKNNISTLDVLLKVVSLNRNTYQITNTEAK